MICHYVPVRSHVIGLIELFYNSSFPAKSWQDPASINIQWLPTIECQSWQDSAMIWQENVEKLKCEITLPRLLPIMYVVSGNVIFSQASFCFEEGGER